jgi:hypothetical protein
MSGRCTGSNGNHRSHGRTEGAYEAFQELNEAVTQSGIQPFAVVLISVGQAPAGHRDQASAALGTLEEFARAGTIGNDELALAYAAIGESKRRASISSAHVTSVRRRSPTLRWSRS